MSGWGEVNLRPAWELRPDGLDRLVDVARAEGVGNVARVRAALVEQGRRFDGRREAMLVALDVDAEVVGIGGMTPCLTVRGAVRMRRFYVHPGWRRRGVARALADAVIERGFRAVPVLTCNAAASAAAPPFWEALGFRPVDGDGITHALWRDDRWDAGQP